MEFNETVDSRERRAHPKARWPDPTKTSVMVVDDEPAFLRVLVRFLEKKGYRVRPFESSLEAREALRAECPDLLLTDRRMPGLNGLELAEAALEEDPGLPVILLTGAGDVASATDGLRIGLTDYLLKPPSLDELEQTLWRALLRRAQENFHQDAEAWMREELDLRAQDAVRKAQQLEDVTVGAFAALVRVLENRSPQYKGHSGSVAELAKAVAEECRLPPSEIVAIQTAAYLHDIGMIAVSDAIIEKPSRLTDDEARQMRSHCRVGADILRPFTHLGPVSDYVLLHHERVDGSGYPNGLKGRDVPLGAQIVGIADTFCAMTEARPFRTGDEPEVALEKIRDAEDRWFAARVVGALEAATAGITSRSPSNGRG